MALASTYLYSIIVVLASLAIITSSYFTWAFIRKIKGIPCISSWCLRFILVVFFTIAYLIVLWLYGRDFFSQDSESIILAFPLLGGSFFALIDTYIVQKTFEEVQASNVALANANVNMAQLYAQLDELTSNLEMQKNTLHQAYEDLQKTQSQMIQMEKLAALGQLIAGIAHEINTPMGAINASSTSISDLLQKKFPQIAQTLQESNPAELELLNTLVNTALAFKGSVNSKESRTHRKRIEHFLEEHEIPQSEDVSTLLSEMHIYGDLEPLLEHFRSPSFTKILNTAYSLSSIYENSKTIEISTHKVKKIIFALKNFSHVERTEKNTQFDLKQNIETVVTLYENQMKYGINLHVHYDDEIPWITGFPDELGQVWTNLIHNALQAMDFAGSLSIDVRQDEKFVYVSVTDTGGGIDKDIQESIFQPFFTTKRAGEGTGLGLHIVKQIVEEKHNGKIYFESMPGKTTFTVQIPKD